MKITKYFMERPTLFWSFMVGILLMGVLAFMQMPKLEDPAVAVKQAMVIVPYQGASAHEVELKVAKPLEDVLRTLPQVRRLKSTCQQGMAQIAIEYALETEQSNLEQYFDLLRRKVADNRQILPQDCMDPIVMDDMMDVYGIFYSLSGEGYTISELERYAQYIRRELLQVKGVKRISIGGTRREVINIIIEPERIAQNGLIPTQIMMQLQGAGKTVNAGNYQTDDQRLMLTVNDAVQDEEDIRNLLISTTDGKTVRLGDLARVERTYAEPQTMGFWAGGNPAIAICVSMDNDAVVPDVGERVEQRMADIAPNIPVGMEVQKVFFQPDKVNDAISGFMVNLLESVLIVILVLMLTMGFKSGLNIGLGLILTIALSFPILLCLGTTLQRISLGTFIIAMGMLVDNAIVIMDGILVDRQKGLPASVYLYRVGQRTMMPLLGATVIGASTFVCIYMSPGSTGEYAGDLFLVLCVSLLVSWALALVQVPVCARFMMRDNVPAQASDTATTTEDDSMTADGFPKKDKKLNHVLRRIIIRLVDHKKTSVAVAMTCLILAGLGMTRVKNLFFPDFEYKQFVIEYSLPAEAGPDRVKHDLLEITDLLLARPEIESVEACQGTAPARYCLVRPMGAGGASDGELIVDCPDFETVKELIPSLRDELRARYPDAYIRLRKYNFSIATSHKVEVMFQGPDPAVLRRLSAQAEEIMRQCPLVDPYTVQNNWKPKVKTLQADYIQQDALRSSIQRGDVGNALLAASDGMPCGVINDGDKQVVVQLQMREADGTQIKDLSNIPVWSMVNIHLDAQAMSGLMTGATKQSDMQRDMFRATPLSSVVRDVDLKWDESNIYRVNGQRAMEAECDPNEDIYEATVTSVMDAIRPQIESIPLPDGYTLTWVGETDTSGEATTALLDYLPITLFAILGILLLLFNSWRAVCLILCCLPFVICGIAPMLLAFRIPFTFMAIIGVEGLIGMMAKNAIVLVDEINRLRNEENQHPYYAVINATVSRIRPVIMASLTTILGMAPLLSDPMYDSMAMCIMGGLAVGTLVTLVLLPLLYTVLYKVRRPIEEKN